MGSTNCKLCWLIFYLIIMSIFPKKYHDSDTKCWGVGFCPDCTERAKKGIPLDKGILEQENNKKLEESLVEILKLEKKAGMNQPLATMKPECCPCYRREHLNSGCKCSCHNKY